MEWRSGNSQAFNKLVPLVYNELHKLARHKMQNEREGHTLQHTALVHEAYIKLVQMDISWNDRAHFFAMAARAMRHILVDHARTKIATKEVESLKKFRSMKARLFPADPPSTFSISIARSCASRKWIPARVRSSNFTILAA